MHVLSRWWRICFSRNIVSQLSQVSHFGNSGMMYKTVQVESSKEVNCDSNANTQWMHVKDCSNILKNPSFIPATTLNILSLVFLLLRQEFQLLPHRKGEKNLFSWFLLQKWLSQILTRCWRTFHHLRF